MDQLHQIQAAVRQRAQEITNIRPAWPCRKGCDECCRRLASMPRITRPEWELLRTALDALPADTAELVRRRIRESAAATRPIVCPLLDTNSGSCLIYEARPIACRAYGFFAERQDVLGCSRIEAIGQEATDIVWGNQTVLEEQLSELGAAADLRDWLAAER